MTRPGIQFAFLFPNTEKDFQEQHFRELGPAIAGQCTQNMKYQLFDAFCEYETDFAKDPKIKPAELTDWQKITFCHLNYRGVYYLVLDEVGKRVYFLWIVSRFNSIFAFFDVQ